MGIPAVDPSISADRRSRGAQGGGSTRAARTSLPLEELYGAAIDRDRQHRRCDRSGNEDDIALVEQRAVGRGPKAQNAGRFGHARSRHASGASRCRVLSQRVSRQQPGRST